MKKVLFLFVIPFLSFSQIVTEDCNSIPNPGPCFGCGIIYWFNPTTSQCEEACWGLCDGLVPFWTLEDCQNSCENSSFIQEIKPTKSLLTIIDYLGRKNNKHQGFQVYIYDDGSIERKYLIK